MMLGPMQRISKVEKRKEESKMEKFFVKYSCKHVSVYIAEEKEDTRKLFTALGFKPTQRLLDKEIPEYQIVIKG